MNYAGVLSMKVVKSELWSTRAMSLAWVFQGEEECPMVFSLRSVLSKPGKHLRYFGRHMKKLSAMLMVLKTMAPGLRISQRAGAVGKYFAEE